MTDPAPLASVRRGLVEESLHVGHLVVTDPHGRHLFSAGDPRLLIYPRSALKPIQALGMLRCGLELPADLLALACASHSGEPMHLDGVRRLLARHGLTDDDLDNTPTLPLGADAAAEWLRAGRSISSVAQNCSGKHAAMLACCVHSGWPTRGYLEPDHPLQRAIAATVAEQVGDLGPTGVDGCGAPALTVRLDDLAAAFSRLAAEGAGEADTPAAQVARAMRAFPQLVGGTGRDVTDLMASVPRLVAKDGAEGVYAMGVITPSGTFGVALKVADGADRARPVVLAAVLADLGVDPALVAAFTEVPVLGHGRPVGSVSALTPWRPV